MLYTEIIAVCSQIQAKHVNALCGQNRDFLNDCQRDRSCSTRLGMKTYLRKVAGQDRPNGMVLLIIHSEIEVSSKHVLD
jgi:hypothetical protein